MPQAQPATRPRLQALMIALAVAFMATQFDFVLRHLIAEVDGRINGRRIPPSDRYRTLRDVAFLVFGALLVATHPVRSGLTLGTGTHRRKAFAVCAFIIGGTLVYRFVLEGDAFDNWRTSWSIWAISPIGQELVFSGFILGLLNEQFPRWWHRSVPITTAAVVSALLFGMWHFIPDFVFAHRDLDYVGFRLLYTAGGWLFYAMTRIWTGTILYAVLMHLAVNFIALGL